MTTCSVLTEKSLLNRVVTWRARGISVIPLRPRDKKPLVTWTPYRDRLPREDELRWWFDRGQERNIGVITGRGLVVLDFDRMDVYDLFCYACEPPETYQVKTGRGMHMYYWIDEPVKQANLPWVEIKSGGYVVGAGSIHPTGHVYTDNGAEIARVARLADISSMFEPPAQYAKKGGTPPPPHTEQKLSKPPAVPFDPDDPLASASYPEYFTFSARIKRRFRAADFVPGIRQTGQGWGMALCPLHEDHNPSLSVNLNTGDVKCLAGCNNGKWMDIIRYYALLNKRTDAEAILELSRWL